MDDMYNYYVGCAVTGLYASGKFNLESHWDTVHVANIAKATAEEIINPKEKKTNAKEAT